MNTINFKLPEWIDENQTLTLLCGQELIAFKHPNEEWKIKKIRCNQCGECCMNIPDNFLYGTNGEGKCNKLVKEGDKWLCTAGKDKPFCCLQDPANIEEIGCCIRYN
jgi:hypothetical protein